MKYIKDVEIKNKRVILRCDFNVPVHDGKISDDKKIKDSLPTIKYLLDNNNIVIILSHFGRVKQEEDKGKNSLSIVYEYLKQFIDLEFISNPLDLSPINKSTFKCFLVENTRFTDIPVKKESDNDLELAKYWSSFGDVFVIDAFASLHRAHSSTAGLSTYLKTYGGFLVEHELTNLHGLIDDIKRPFVVIMGGAKVDDKIEIIKALIKNCDHLIITGGILNTFLKVLGYEVGQSLVSSDPKILDMVQILINNYRDKISYSDNFIVQRGNKHIIVKLQDITTEDIIYDNIIDDNNILKNAKTIFYNGTCGFVEDKDFQKGTLTLLNILSKMGSNTYIGGGDTAGFVKEVGLTSQYKYISSGGGATLEYVAYHKLKALEYIEKYNVI